MSTAAVSSRLLKCDLNCNGLEGEIVVPARLCPRNLPPPAPPLSTVAQLNSVAPGPKGRLLRCFSSPVYLKQQRMKYYIGSGRNKCEILVGNLTNPGRVSKLRVITRRQLADQYQVQTREHAKNDNSSKRLMIGGGWRSRLCWTSTIT